MRRDKWMQTPLETFSDTEVESLAEKYETSGQSDKRWAFRDESAEPGRKPPRAQPHAGININITVNVIGTHSRRRGASADGESEKSRAVAFVICLLFGFLGGHYFYCGRFGMGVVFLLTMGFAGLGWAIDLIRIAAGKFPDRLGYYI